MSRERVNLLFLFLIVCTFYNGFVKIIIGDTMNSKKIAYVLMTLSFIMIISGGVSSFVLGLKADRIETQKRINTVNNEFEVLSTNTTIFENVRDELYNKILSNVYYIIIQIIGKYWAHTYPLSSFLHKM